MYNVDCGRFNIPCRFISFPFQFILILSNRNSGENEWRACACCGRWKRNSFNENPFGLIWYDKFRQNNKYPLCTSHRPINTCVCVCVSFRFVAFIFYFIVCTFSGNKSLDKPLVRESWARFELLCAVKTQRTDLTSFHHIDVIFLSVPRI